MYCIKFFNLSLQQNQRGQKTGLKLSLSYDIIKAYGGEIKVETKERERVEFVILLKE